MTITITRYKLALSVLAAVLIGTGIAGASDNDNPFTDVEDVGATDERFYSAPIEWLWDNNLTTGSPSGSDTFKPLDNVTRGEYAAFNFRYDENVVQPALTALQTRSDNVLTIEEDAALFDFAEGFAADLYTGLTAEALPGATVSVTIPEGRTGNIVASFGAESACYANSDGCTVVLEIDGTAIESTDALDYAFDSSDGGTEGSQSWEQRTVVRISEELAAGTYAITVDRFNQSAGTFRLDDWVLTAEVRLTS